MVGRRLSVMRLKLKTYLVWPTCRGEEPVPAPTRIPRLGCGVPHSSQFKIDEEGAAVALHKIALTRRSYAPAGSFADATLSPV